MSLDWKQLLDPGARGREAVELAHSIKQAYGYILENRVGLVSDEADLPLPKEAIKLSLLVMHAVMKDDQARILFHQGYAWLGFFQPLTTEEKTALISFSGNIPPTLQKDVGPETLAALRTVYADSKLALPVLEKAWHQYDELFAEFATVTGRKGN
jgi:hypothetical protein